MTTRLQNVYKEMTDNLEFITGCFSLEEIAKSYKKSGQERFDLYLKNIVDNSDNEEIKDSYDEFCNSLYKEFGNKLMLCTEVYFVCIKEPKEKDLNDFYTEDRIGMEFDEVENEKVIGTTKRVMLMVNLNIDNLMDFLYDVSEIQNSWDYSILNVDGPFLFYDGETYHDSFCSKYSDEFKFQLDKDMTLKVFEDEYENMYEDLEKFPNATIKIVK